MKNYQHRHTFGYPYKEGIEHTNITYCNHTNTEYYNPYWFAQSKRCKDCGKDLNGY